MTYLDEVEARANAATPGPWVFGAWDILKEDREAQREGEAYWTLTDNRTLASGNGLARGPFGRKSKDIDNVISPEGWETEGLSCNSADESFIAHSRTDIPELLARLRLAATVLEGGCSCQEERFLTKRDDLLCDPCEALKAILR